MGMSIRLPDLEQDVKIDKSDILAAIAAAKAFKEAMDKALKIDTDKLHRGLANVNADLAETAQNSRRASEGMDALDQAAQRVHGRMNALRNTLQNLRQDLENIDRSSGNVSKNFGTIVTAMDRLSNSARSGRSNLRGYADELQRIGQNVGNAGTGLRGIEGNIENLDDTFRRSSGTLRDYNNELANLGRAGNAANGPRLADNFRDDAEGARRAEHNLDELREAAARLAATLAALEGVADSLGGRLGGIGDPNDAAEIEHLKSEIEELKRELLGVSGASVPAARGIKNVGKEARDAAAGVALLNGVMGVMNAAIAPEIIVQTSKIGTIFEGMVGTLGAVGAGVGQLFAGGIGLGQALAPILNLAGVIPSAVTGIALLGVTIKSAFNTDVANEFTEQIKANKKAFEDLSNTIVTTIQSETTPAFTRLTEAAKNLSPILETGFRRMGSVVKEVMDDISGDFFLSNPEFQDRFARLFDSAALQARNYGYVATNSLFGVTIAATKAIPVAEKLSETFKDMSKRFKDYVSAAANDGRLEAAFERGYQTLMRVFSMVQQLGVGLADLGRIAKSVGLDESILQGFERATTGIRNFAKTYHNELVGTFNNSIGLFNEIGSLVSQVVRTITLDLGQIKLSPLAHELTGIVEILGKMALPAGNALVEGFRDILNAVGNARGPLINISTVLSTVLTSLGNFGSSIIPKLIGPLQQISVEIARFVRDVAEVATDLVPALTGPFAQIVASSRRMVTAIIETVAPLVKQIAQPFADAFSLVQDTIAQTATSISGPLQGAFANVLPALSDAFRDVVPAVGELITKIIELVAAFSNSFGGAITGVVSILTPIIGIFTSLAEAAAVLPDPLKAIVVALLGMRLISGIGPMLSGLAGHFTGLGGAIRGAFAGAGGGLAGIRAGLGSFMTFLGGPWGLVLAGAATALVLFGMAQQDAKQQAAEHKAALDELAQTMDSVTGKATAMTMKKIGENLFEKGVIDDLERFGSSIGEATNAMAKGGEQLDAFKNKTVASFLAAVNGSKEFQDEINRVDEATGQATGAAALAMQDFARAGSFSLQSLAQAWAGGNNAYTAYAQKIASETGMSVDAVKNGFEAIRSSVDRNVGGAASSLSAFGDEIANVGEAGVQVRTLFEGMAAGAAEALREIDGFQNVTNTQLLNALDNAYTKGIPVTQALKEIGVTGHGAAVVLASLGDLVDGSSGKLTGMGDAAREIRDALQQVADQANQGIPGAEKLADAFQKMGDQASTAADKARALQDILEIMNGGTKELQKAQFDWAESLDQVKAKIGQLNEENSGFIQGLNDSNGALDANNQQHREFRKQLEGMTSDYSAINASVYQNVKAAQGQEAALKAVYESAITQRQAFLDAAQSMGISEAAANALADQLGLIPEQVRLAFSMDGTDKLVQTQIAGIVAQLEGMPEGKITINNPDGSMDEALKKMETLGYTVERGLNGKVTITDNLAGVRTQVDDLVGQISQIPEGRLEVDSSSISEGAKQALIDLGYQINTIPGGKVEILSNSAQVDKDVQGLISQVQNMPTGDIRISEAVVTQETRAKLTELGYTVSSLPNGNLVIASNAGETQTQINSLADRVQNMPSGSINVSSSEVTESTKRVLEAMGYTITTLPNGTVNITSNAAIVNAEVDGVRAKVEKSMNGIIVIDSATTTNEAIQRLSDMGFKIENTPDGDFIITDNTPEANGRIDGVKSNINSIPDGDSYINVENGAANANIADTQGRIQGIPDGSANIDVTTSGVGAAESSISWVARARTAVVNVIQSIVPGLGGAIGGVFKPMATGGVLFNAQGNMADMYKRAKKWPMSNNIATIVPPNTPRVIGDNMRRDELFMPIDPYSGRSHALLQQGAFRMGYDLVPRGTRRAGGPTFFADGGISSMTKANMVAAGRYLNESMVNRTVVTTALRTQSAVISEALRDQAVQLRDLMKNIVEAPNAVNSAAGVGGKSVEFTFNQYNPQQVPASEMINRGLQLVAAAGLI